MYYYLGQNWLFFFQGNFSRAKVPDFHPDTQGDWSPGMEDSPGREPGQLDTRNQHTLKKESLIEAQLTFPTGQKHHFPLHTNSEND